MDIKFAEQTLVNGISEKTLGAVLETYQQNSNGLGDRLVIVPNY